MCVCDACKYSMADTCIHKLEASERPDRGGAECRVPAMWASEMGAKRQVCERACIGVQHCAYLPHICKTVVIFCSQGESAESCELRYSYGVEMPTYEPDSLEAWVASEKCSDHLGL